MADAKRGLGKCITAAQAQAKIAFKDAYRLCKRLQEQSGRKVPWWALARMRNAWLAYHAGEPWMLGVAPALHETAVRQGIGLNDGPKPLADHVADAAFDLAGLRVDQRTRSDCLRCCVAMVLGVPYDDVPDFVDEHGYAWAGALANWALDRGYHTLRFLACGDGEMLQSLEGGIGMWIATGRGPRGGDHAVVFEGFSMFHDPHESRAGLSELTGATVFLPLLTATRDAAAIRR